MKYIRDKRSPKPSSDTASRVMSSIRAKNTKPELIIRKLLWEKNLKGYRLHYKIPGRPDIVYPRRKLAIFIHGCYWHRCPNCDLPLPKSNTEFWKEKFQKNVARDRQKKEILKELGWIVLVFWECQIRSDPQSLIEQVRTLLEFD